MPKQVKWDSSRLRRKVKSGTRAGMEKACILLRDYVVNSFGRSPSSPGEPPGVDTNRLRSSITYEVEERGKEVIGRVGTNVKYGVFLEYGTSRMAARPYFRPALKTNKAKIRRFLAGK